MIKEDGRKQATREEPILIEQYKTAIEMYRHEDNLNWTKINHLFYINAGLWALVGLSLKIKDCNKSIAASCPLFLVMLAVTGIVVSLALGNALWFGTMYMQYLKDRAVVIEKVLFQLGGERILSGTTGWREKSPTVWTLRIVPIVFFIVWLLLLTRVKG